jgi:hypothetical protein
MGYRKVLNIRIDVELEHYGRQIASSQLRTFPNYIETLIRKDIQINKKAGFIFSEYNSGEITSLEVTGKGKDDVLANKFNDFIKNKP